MAPIAAALPIISAVAGIGGTALGVYSSYQQAQAQKADLKYQADMANYNAQVAEGNAQLAEYEGEQIKKDAYEDSLKQRQLAATLVGEQRAAQAASGVQVDVGSSLDKNLDTVEKGEIDALAMQEQGQWGDYNKKLDAWGLRNQGAQQTSKAQLHSSKAQQVSPFLQTTPTLLSGIKQVGTSFGKLT